MASKDRPQSARNIHSQTTTPLTASSILSNVSAGSFTPAAFTLSAICSGREAPMIAELTSGSRSTHASAICAIVSPKSAAIGFNSSTAFSRKSDR